MLDGLTLVKGANDAQVHVPLALRVVDVHHLFFPIQMTLALDLVIILNNLEGEGGRVAVANLTGFLVNGMLDHLVVGILGGVHTEVLLFEPLETILDRFLLDHLVKCCHHLVECLHLWVRIVSLKRNPNLILPRGRVVATRFKIATVKRNLHLRSLNKDTLSIVIEIQSLTTRLARVHL